MRTERLPGGRNWIYELTLDGHRALGIKTNGKVHLRSPNDKDFNGRNPAIVKAVVFANLDLVGRLRVEALPFPLPSVRMVR
jgi:ATP-dependent DNA ligase